MNVTEKYLRTCKNIDQTKNLPQPLSMNVIECLVKSIKLIESLCCSLVLSSMIVRSTKICSMQNRPLRKLLLFSWSVVNHVSQPREENCDENFPRNREENYYPTKVVAVDQISLPSQLDYFASSPAGVEKGSWGCIKFVVTMLQHLARNFIDP